MEKFWMVYVEDGNPPSSKHDTYEEAVAEVERLARKENKPVYLLIPSKVCRVKVVEPPVVWEFL